MKIKDLRLAVTAAATKDIRFYLNSALVTRDKIVASNGACLCLIKNMNNSIPDGIEKIIIPASTIKSFLNKFNKKDADLTINIEQFDNFYLLKSGSNSEMFESIDSKYPDFKKVIDEIEAHEEPSVFHNYNWQYLAIASKAIIEHDSYNYRVFRATQNFGYFSPDNNIVYVVMPLKD